MADFTPRAAAFYKPTQSWVVLGDGQIIDGRIVYQARNGVGFVFAADIDNLMHIRQLTIPDAGGFAAPENLGRH